MDASRAPLDATSSVPESLPSHSIFPLHYEHFPCEIKQEILLRVQDNIIFTISLVDKVTNALCDELFWWRRFVRIFEVDLGADRDYKRIYKQLRKLNSVDLFLKASKKGYLPLIIRMVELKIMDINLRGAQLLNIMSNRCAWGGFGLHYSDCNTLIDHALRVAVSNGMIPVAKYLIENGANINANYKYNGGELDGINISYPLYHAIYSNTLDMVKFLVEYGAKIHDNNMLKVASGCGTGNIFKYLLEKYGPDGKYKYEYESVISIASQKGYLDIVKCIIEHCGPEAHLLVHSDDDGALQDACIYGHRIIAKYLIENGANVHAQNDISLRFAVANGHLDIVQYLVEHGANVNVNHDWSFAHAVVTGKLDALKYLIDKNIDIREYIDDAIQYASKFGKLDLVKYFVEQKALKNINTNNEIAIQYAYENNRWNVFNYLQAIDTLTSL